MFNKEILMNLSENFLRDLRDDYDLRATLTL